MLRPDSVGSLLAIGRSATVVAPLECPLDVAEALPSQSRLFVACESYSRAIP